MFRRNIKGLYNLYADEIECTGDIVSYNNINGSKIANNPYLYYIGLSGNIQSQINYLSSTFLSLSGRLNNYSNVPKFQIGSVTTGGEGTAAAVVIDAASTINNVILDFTIPRGATGVAGAGYTASNYVCQATIPANLNFAPYSESNILFTTQYDPQNWIYNSGNWSFYFKPNIAGYYHITLDLMYSTLPSTTYIYAYTRINATTSMICYTQANQYTINSLCGTKVQYFNGTTDSMVVIMGNPNSSGITVYQGWFTATLLMYGGQGAKGDIGPTGVTPNITVGSVTTGSTSSVTKNVNSTATNAIFDFVLQKGDTGITPNITIGSVTSGSTTSVTKNASSTSTNTILDFVLQKGENGSAGPAGPAIISLVTSSSYITFPTSNSIYSFGGVVRTLQSFPQFNAWLSFVYTNTITSNTSINYVGFSTNPSSQTINYGLYFDNGTLKFVTNMVLSSDSTTYTNQDQFNLLLTSKGVYIYKNGVQIKIIQLDSSVTGPVYGTFVLQVASYTNIAMGYSVPPVDGTNGTNGTTPTFHIGTVSTGYAGSSASVSINSSSTSSDVILDFTIPRGSNGGDASVTVANILSACGIALAAGAAATTAALVSGFITTNNVVQGLHSATVQGELAWLEDQVGELDYKTQYISVERVAVGGPYTDFAGCTFRFFSDADKHNRLIYIRNDDTIVYNTLEVNNNTLRVTDQNGDEIFHVAPNGTIQNIDFIIMDKNDISVFRVYPNNLRNFAGIDNPCPSTIIQSDVEFQDSQNAILMKLDHIDGQIDINGITKITGTLLVQNIQVGANAATFDGGFVHKGTAIELIKQSAPHYNNAGQQDNTGYSFITMQNQPDNNTVFIGFKANLANVVYNCPDALIGVAPNPNNMNRNEGIMIFKAGNYNFVNDAQTNGLYMSLLNNNSFDIKIKANKANNTNNQDVSIKVIGANPVNNVAAANDTGSIQVCSTSVALSVSPTTLSFIMAYNYFANRIALVFKANEANNQRDAGIFCSGVAGGAEYSGTLEMYSANTNLCVAPAQVINGNNQSYSYINCSNNYQGTLSMRFKADNTNALNNYDASITVETKAIQAQKNNAGGLTISASEISIGTRVGNVAGTGANHIYIGDTNTITYILGSVEFASGEVFIVDPLVDQLPNGGQRRRKL